MSRPRPGVVRRSSLCEGRVVHHRHGRPRHDFGYRVFLTLLDLDELPLLDRELRLFGYNRLRPVAFRDSDHLAASRRGVRADLVTAVEGAGHTMPDGRVELLTHCRILGYVFKPVNVFYCYDRNDRLTLAVAEVTTPTGTATATSSRWPTPLSTGGRRS